MVAAAPDPRLRAAFVRLMELATTDYATLRDDQLGVIIDELNDIVSDCEAVFDSKWRMSR